MSEIIQLKFPVECNGEEILELELRRPKVRDQLAATKRKGSDEEKEINLLADLCDVSPEVIADLDLADYAQLGEVYQGFLK